jgi:hypothetical protein
MSNKSELITDKLVNGMPVALRPKGGRLRPFTWTESRDRSKAYSSNRTKSHKKKK